MPHALPIIAAVLPTAFTTMPSLPLFAHTQVKAMNVADAIAQFALLLGLLVDVLLIYLYLARRFRREPSPPEQVQSVPWTVADALGIFVFFFLLTEFLSTGILGMLLLMGLEQKEAQQLTQLAAGSLLRPLVAFGLLIALSQLRKAGLADFLGRPLRPTGKAFAVGLVVFVAVLPSIVWLGSVSRSLSRLFSLPTESQQLVQWLRGESSIPIIVAILLMAVLIAPVFEEIFFRGFLYPALKKQFGAPLGALFLSAGFALMHFNAPAFLPLFFLSFCLILAYELTGTIWTSVAVHMSFNCFFVCMALLTRT